MLNKIILNLIQRNTSLPVQAMTTDVYENPSAYKGWIYPLRYLLALRYLKKKQQTLEDFRSQKIYPIQDSDYKEALIKILSGKKRSAPSDSKFKNPISALGFKSKLIYPVALIAVAIGAVGINQWKQERKIENIFANHLPYFSDLLHRKLIFIHNDQEQALSKLEISIKEEEQKILSELPEKNGIRDIVEKQLTRLKDSTTTSEEVMLGFKDVNTVFDQHNLPFYLSPKSFTMPCSSLIDAPVEQMMMLKELESLMSNNNPELCRTTMMTAYKVDDRKQLFYDTDKDTVELPLFRVRRIDKVPAVDSALGLTFKDRGIGSIILLERIANFAKESVLPALSFQGRNYIIPYWMQGYYEIEEAVTKAYKKDLSEIYPDKKDQRQIKLAVKSLISDKFRMSNAKMQQTMQRENSNSEKNIFGNGFDAISVFLGKQTADTKKKQKIKTTKKEFEPSTLHKLDNVLLPSIEYHEAYHQINKKKWNTPPWLKTTFKDKLSENAIDHTMEELGAYLAQLANTNQGQKIWLSKLLIFSLNPMTKGQAEYYASSIIFNTMESLYLGLEVEPSYIATVDEKTKIFKTLTSKNQSEIKALAKAAYEKLFGRPVPLLRQ